MCSNIGKLIWTRSNARNGMPGHARPYAGRDESKQVKLFNRSELRVLTQSNVAADRPTRTELLVDVGAPSCTESKTGDEMPRQAKPNAIIGKSDQEDPRGKEGNPVWMESDVIIAGPEQDMPYAGGAKPRRAKLLTGCELPKSVHPLTANP